MLAVVAEGVRRAPPAWASSGERMLAVVAEGVRRAPQAWASSGKLHQHRMSGRPSTAGEPVAADLFCSMYYYNA